MISGWLQLAQSRELYLTQTGRGDGGGAQAWSTIVCMATAQAIGCRYAHTPFERIAHNSGRDTTWSTNWEAFFNLGHEEVSAAALMEAGADCVQLTNATDAPAVPDGDGKLVVAAGNFITVCRLGSGRFEALQTAIRRKFRAGQGAAWLQTGLDPSVLRIVAHVRRNDISATRNAGRFIDNDRFLELLGAIRTRADEAGLRCEWHIISDGRAEELQDFSDFGCQLWLGEPPFASIARLIQADIKVVGRSAFGWMGALLGDGLVLCMERTPLGPVDGWLTRDAIAGWSSADLLTQLSTALGAERMAALRATVPAVSTAF